jgi:hypothetical protein
MSEIVARVLLFMAYSSILASTLGWFGNAHVAMLR